MEIFEIIMETFTLGTAIGLNMTHNAAAWNRARLVEAELSCFSWCINALMKSTRLESFQRNHGKRVQFTSETSIWNCFVWLRQERSNIYGENYQLYILNSIGKTPFCQTCEDKHWQSNCPDIQWRSSFPWCAISISDFRCFKLIT